MTSTHRTPAGVPTGGQFAPTAHAEADVDLGADYPGAAGEPVTDLGQFDSGTTNPCGEVAVLTAPTDDEAAAFTPAYSSWRHGGWYVDNVHYPSGAVGCVSRNFKDKKWRIVCDPRPFDQQPTFPNRDAAARAEYQLAPIAKQVEDAVTAGRDAAKADRSRAAAADPQITAMLEGQPVGSAVSRTVLGAWQAGYQYECDRAAAAVLAGE